MPASGETDRGEPDGVPMSTKDVVDRSRTLLELNRPEEAARLLGPAAAGHANPELHALLVLALWTAGRTQDAAVAGEHGIALLGPHPDLARIASYVFADLRQPARALPLARAAVEARPDWVPGLLALARAHAVAALASRPPWLPWVPIGLALTRARATSGKHGNAEAAISRALALAPDEARVHVAAGDVSAAGFRLGLARTRYQTALRLDPTAVDPLFGLGLLAQRRARYGQAARWYMQALAVKPGDKRVQHRVRGLFGQIFFWISLAAGLFNFTVFVAFMSVAAPEGAASSPVVSALAVIVVFATFGGLLWLSIRAAPRALLDTFRSEARAYRQARRTLRRTTLQLALLAVAVLAAVVPGDVDTRAGIAGLAFVAGFVVWTVNLIGMRLAFGRDLRRPASR